MKLSGDKEFEYVKCSKIELGWDEAKNGYWSKFSILTSLVYDFFWETW